MKQRKYRARITPDEIGTKYDLIADTYEQERSMDIGINYVRMFVQLLPHPEDCCQNSVLDIGCGTGLPLTRFLATSKLKVTGIDISSKMIEKAEMNVPFASFMKGDIITAGFENQFDGILAWDSLFHIPIEKQEMVIRKILALLKSNGVFLFTSGGTYGEIPECLARISITVHYRQNSMKRLSAPKTVR